MFEVIIMVQTMLCRNEKDSNSNEDVMIIIMGR